MKLETLLSGLDGPEGEVRSSVHLVEPLTIDRALTLSGVGEAEVRFETRESQLKLRGHGPFVFRGLTFRHTQAGCKGLVVVEDAQVVFEDCRFEDAGGSCDSFAQGVRCLGRSWCTFERCYFETNDIHLQLDNDSRAELRQCQMREALTDAVLVNGKAQLQAVGCRLEDSGWNGVLATHQARLSLLDCHLSGHGAHGLGLADQARLESRRCEYRENAQNGLCADGSGSVISHEDTFFGNHLCGADMGDTVQVFMQACDAEANASHGFQLRGEVQVNMTDCSARNNDCSGVAVFGKSCLTSHDLVSESNKLNGAQFADKSLGLLVRASLTQNRSSGLAAFGMSRPIVERSRLAECFGFGVQTAELALLNMRDCEVLDNRKGGLLLSGKGTAFLEVCTVAENRVHGVAVTDTASLTMSDNTVQDNHKDGILLMGNGSSQLLGNQVIRNKRYGIFAAAGSRPLLEDNECCDNEAEQLRVETTRARTSDRNTMHPGESLELPTGVTLSVDSSAELHLPFEPKPLERSMLMALLRHKRLSEKALGKAAQSRRVGGAMENLIDRLHQAGLSYIRHEGDGPEGNVYALKLDTSRSSSKPITNPENQGRQIC